MLCLAVTLPIFVILYKTTEMAQLKFINIRLLFNPYPANVENRVTS